VDLVKMATVNVVQKTVMMRSVIRVVSTVENKKDLVKMEIASVREQ
jgi:hypothetical protein